MGPFRSSRKGVAAAPLSGASHAAAPAQTALPQAPIAMLARGWPLGRAPRATRGLEKRGGVRIGVRTSRAPRRLRPCTPPQIRHAESAQTSTAFVGCSVRASWRAALPLSTHINSHTPALSGDSRVLLKTTRHKTSARTQREASQHTQTSNRTRVCLRGQQRAQLAHPSFFAVAVKQ